MEDELHDDDKPVRKTTLTAWNAQVGDKFVSLMWEPILGELAATFEIVSRYVDGDYVVYETQYVISYDGKTMPGNKTSCTGGVEVRKVF
jgi:hypothetical protein